MRQLLVPKRKVTSWFKSSNNVISIIRTGFFNVGRNLHFAHIFTLELAFARIGKNILSCPVVQPI